MYTLFLSSKISRLSKHITAWDGNHLVDAQLPDTSCSTGSNGQRVQSDHHDPVGPGPVLPGQLIAIRDPTLNSASPTSSSSLNTVSKFTILVRVKMFFHALFSNLFGQRTMKSVSLSLNRKASTLSLVFTLLTRFMGLSSPLQSLSLLPTNPKRNMCAIFTMRAMTSFSSKAKEASPLKQARPSFVHGNTWVPLLQNPSRLSDTHLFQLDPTSIF